MKQLEELDIYNSHIEDLSALKNLSYLKKINLAFCENLHDVSALLNIKSIKEIYIVECPANNASLLNEIQGL